MSKKKSQKAPKQSRGLPVSWALTSEPLSAFTGYTRLSDVPEIQTAIERVAEIVSSMTIHLIENSKNGDKRIKNELSRKIDINPCRYTTRKAWVDKIAKDMLQGGNSIHLPHFKGSILDDIEPIPIGRATIQDENSGYGYYVTIRGVRYEHDEVLHFSLNPDPDRPWYGRGHVVTLKSVAKNLGQERRTANAIMEKPLPSLIVRVDGLLDEFTTVAGRKKLSAQYLDDSEAGRPWFIPSQAFEVDQVKPLSLSDLAIADSMDMDKRTAASIIGVPPFVVGAGDFNSDEYNNFIRSIVLPIARSIEQELTRKLLVSPNWYFRFNPRSMYAYSITEITEVVCNLTERAILDRNEGRDWLGYEPREGLSELAILENYIPYSMIGEQKKLKDGEKKEKGAADGTKK